MDSKKIAIALLCSIFFAGGPFAMELTNFQKDTSDQSLTLPNFEAAAQQKVLETIKVGPDRHIRLNGAIEYIGKKTSDLVEFEQQLKLFLKNYENGNRFTEKIVVNERDKIKIKNFSDYFLNNLFELSISNGLELSPEFKNFRERNGIGFGPYRFRENSMLFTLMYIFDDIQSDVSINTKTSYNNYKFTFSPCPNKDLTAGEPIALEFKAINASSRVSYLLQIEDNDTVAHKLFFGMNGIDASYKVAAFKIAEDTYRLSITLSTRDSPYRSFLTQQKAADFLVRIK